MAAPARAESERAWISAAKLGGAFLVGIEQEDPVGGAQRSGELALQVVAAPGLVDEADFRGQRVVADEVRGGVGGAGIDDDDRPPPLAPGQ